MAELRPLIVKAAKMITDCMDAKFGLVKMDETRPEYWMLDHILSDDMARMALKMGVRKPTTPDVLARKLGWSLDKTQSVLDEMVKVGIVEYNWHNSDHHKQYVLPVFVVGSAENFMLNAKLMEEFPETAEFFYQMGELPLKLLSHMVPPGGAGLGFHVIPVENAIPHQSESLGIEHLSHWLEKYCDRLAVTDCVCRKSMRIRGEGGGELEDQVCMLTGDYAVYMAEQGRARRISYEEAIDLLQRAEDNGYMHQITNGDGKDDIFAMEVAAAVKAMKRSDKKPPEKKLFALEDKVFSQMHPKRVKKFWVNDACVGCGTCARICPRGNITLQERRPTFGTDCIGCLSCVQFCPKEAINVGKITEKRERFPNPGVKAMDLTKKIIHID